MAYFLVHGKGAVVQACLCWQLATQLLLLLHLILLYGRNVLPPVFSVSVSMCSTLDFWGEFIKVCHVCGSVILPAWACLNRKVMLPFIFLNLPFPSWPRPSRNHACVLKHLLAASLKWTHWGEYCQEAYAEWRNVDNISGSNCMTLIVFGDLLLGQVGTICTFQVRPCRAVLVVDQLLKPVEADLTVLVPKQRERLTAVWSVNSSWWERFLFYNEATRIWTV